MTPSDHKIRQYWLIILFIGTFVSIISQLITVQVNPTLPYHGEWYKMIRLAIGFILPIAYSYLFYHCAYKKPGTKFLMFLLICLPISSVLTAILYLTKSLPQIDYPPFFWVVHALSWVTVVVQYYLNWQMRKINLRLRRVSPSL